jgi:acyl-[acyl-carrier-protein]-phospholipid O-acyltransferase/long-chain-fatty-acid--[acyl-carrier-protein] ligase
VEPRAAALFALLDDFELFSLLPLVLYVALGIALFLIFRRPVLLVRFPLWVLTHTIYRVRVLGKENVPAIGPALLVCNHVSYFDWLFLLAAQKRHIQFVVFAGWTKVWGLRHLLRWAGVIPIDHTAGPRKIVQSLQQAAAALKDGHLVCIFAEGRFTRTGFLLPFRRGFEQILKHCSAPILPVCLEQVWGSIFSYWGGKLIWKWPQELPYPVTVAFGKLMPPTAAAAEVRLAIQKLSADCAIERVPRRPLVHRQFVRMAAGHPFRPCLIDPLIQKGKPLSYGKVLVGAICLSRQLRAVLGDDQMVGIWLPPGAPAALANIALALLGKVSVNLNYTASPAVVQSALRQCKLRHVITSKRFTAKVALEPSADVSLLYLEDIQPRISRWQQLRTYLTVLSLPGVVLERWVLGLGRHKPEDLATVIFSSGTMGDPKGVMLTHANIAANAESMIQVVMPRPKDRLLGILPFFHSFGYTVTLWVPLQVGASAAYLPDPRQSRQIGELCRKYQCSLFLATPTFLRLCLRRCEPGDFASLRFLLCGAEKLPEGLAKEFEDKFGIVPLEGYGCTELSPAAAANVPDQEKDGFRQIGNKPGTIGQPLPGVAGRVLDPEKLEPLPPEQEGMLLIYGANVMAGYLGRPEDTQKVIRDGWYVTGDIARYDGDGFLTLTDRLSRFSKIGGEMVPHQRIEDELHALTEAGEQTFVVTAVPDEAKGERLVVLHRPLNGQHVKQLWQQLNDRGLPNLWLPRERDFYQVPEFPILGSGKLDLKRCKELARELSNA